MISGVIKHWRRRRRRRRRRRCDILKHILEVSLKPF